MEYILSWPQVEGAGLGGAWINRYYAHLAGTWRRRWEREVYWQACLELAARREAAHRRRSSPCLTAACHRRFFHPFFP